jgi:protein-tyrosine-phosphatase
MDLVIVMDSAQRSHVARVFGVSPARIIVAGDLDPQLSATRAIADPWGKSLEAFAESFDRLDRCAATISTLIHYSHPNSRTPSP